MSQEIKSCPFCGEEILTIAKKCKHCGSFFDNDISKGIKSEEDVSKKKGHSKVKFEGEKGNSYIENNLMDGENIIYRGKLHWVIFLWTFFWFISAIISFNSGEELAPVGFLFIIIGILTGIASLINFKTSEFGVTNKRVIVKVGFIRRNSLEVLLSKVEGIQVNQGILGRILGFGTITISGTGGTKDPFHKINSPMEFRKNVQEQISVVQDLR